MLYREISITSTVPKKGRLDIRKFEAQEILDPDFKEGKVYRLLSSNRDLTQMLFLKTASSTMEQKSINALTLFTKRIQSFQSCMQSTLVTLS